MGATVSAVTASGLVMAWIESISAMKVSLCCLLTSSRNKIFCNVNRTHAHAVGRVSIYYEARTDTCGKWGAQGRRLSFARPLIEEFFPDVPYIDSDNDRDEDSDTGSMPPLEDAD